MAKKKKYFRIKMSRSWGIEQKATYNFVDTSCASIQLDGLDSFSISSYHWSVRCHYTIAQRAKSLCRSFTVKAPVGALDNCFAI